MQDGDCAIVKAVSRSRNLLWGSCTHHVMRYAGASMGVILLVGLKLGVSYRDLVEQGLLGTPQY